MLRSAIAADLAAVAAIRDAPAQDRLSDPAGADDEAIARLAAGHGVWVWDEAGVVLGFAAVDRGDGRIAALLVAPGHDGKGIGRALLAAACDDLRAAGRAEARIAVEPGSAAARHYSAAGWVLSARTAAGGAAFRKSL